MVILGSGGGHVQKHRLRFQALAQSGAPVEMRGGCWSACTLITAFVPKERLCFGEGAFLAFHAAATDMKSFIPASAPGTMIYSARAAKQMYLVYPPEIKASMMATAAGDF